MYEIRPESIKTFITDRNIRLPRFQRKQTWDEKKNFQLCISLFKEYPMGVCILNIDNDRGRTTRQLLDGRQRRNALIQMYDDPEMIYHWGRRFIGFHNSDQPSEIEDIFYKKINEYLEADSEEEVDVPISESEEVESDDDGVVATEADINEAYGLELLLQIIKLTHNKNKRGTGFTRPFDFVGVIERLPYVEMCDGGYHISSRKLKTFIDEYRHYCDDNVLDYTVQDNFITYVWDRGTAVEGARTKLKQIVQQKWVAIKERIDIVEKIDNLLTNSKIGIIEVKNLTPSDAQKIFNIINSEGEKLTAAEILSAKPHWNVPLHNPSEEVMRQVKALYDQMGLVQEGVVRWDLPATLLARLGSNVIFKDLSLSSKSDFEKKLTLGFKLLAGILEKGVKKEDIEKLGNDGRIDWDLQIERIVNDLCTMLKMIDDFDYFKYMKSWKTSIMDLTSDAIALNYCIIMYEDWLRKGKPIGNNIHAKQFQKNCFILLDKLIFEYVNRKWRGSSDSIIANNISAIANEPELFESVSTEAWSDMLFNEIYNKSTIGGFAVSLKVMKPILYHFYCLCQLQGPDASDIEIDHIIPQALFKVSSIPNKEAIMDNLFNLGLLPKRENVSKSDNKLMLIESQWLKDQIARYEFVAEADYQKFSNIGNYKKLFEMRKEYFEKAFGELRNNLIDN